MKENIEQLLLTWFTQMISKYSWLRIRYEFSNSRGVFLVSFYPVNKIELSDEFNLDAMKFADQLYSKFGNEAPLFTDEEELFRLSSEAETIQARYTSGKDSFAATFICVQPLPYTCAWSLPTSQSSASTGRNFHQSQTETKYALAA